jgi:hypothetical protein
MIGLTTVLGLAFILFSSNKMTRLLLLLIVCVFLGCRAQIPATDWNSISAK